MITALWILLPHHDASLAKLTQNPSAVAAADLRVESSVRTVCNLQDSSSIPPRPVVKLDLSSQSRRLEGMTYDHSPMQIASRSNPDQVSLTCRSIRSSSLPDLLQANRSFTLRRVIARIVSLAWCPAFDASRCILMRKKIRSLIDLPAQCEVPGRRIDQYLLIFFRRF